MLIDTHSHLNFNAYKNDVDEVIKRSLENNVWMINIGSQFETSKKAVELTKKYSQGVYASIGFHPIHLGKEFFKVKMDLEEVSAEENKEKEFNLEDYKKLAESKKVVAIGEIGLDYYYRPKAKIKISLFKEKQKEVFLKQINLAKELNLPVVFHCRSAHDDLIKILKNSPGFRGVIHCFTGASEQAKKYLEMGFYLGFNGIIFKLNLDEIIKETPLEKILLETDCPYLIPLLARRNSEDKNGRNEPVFVKYIAEKIAKIKNLSFEKVAEITNQNAKKLFKI